MSLSIVFGTPTTGMPISSWSSWATVSVPFPPMTIRPSSSRSSKVRLTFSRPSGSSYGLPRRVPSTVPPFGRSPRVVSIVSSSYRWSVTPSQAL